MSHPSTQSEPAPWALIFFCLLAALVRSRDDRLAWYESVNARLSAENDDLRREVQQGRRAA